ncbi:putative metal-dependent hydrolase with the TIM-barrel fold protein [Congregibacter litoralis KT71]|uniref:Putative metal-dependent hydrolase with the TIM-barrel fold protein n=2 Tax=Congregibacter TaxID=393661 RepID=A4ABM2_9GAMM|nr:putative metal-dependent hydrolase with the TIM-barrel fold protein [Congregibacter litoralis KT71]
MNMRGCFLAALVVFPLQLSAATLIHNVRGYTLHDGERLSFTALEYDKGVVTAIYDDAASASASKAAERIDGQGLTLLPGLIDAHGHVAGLGSALASVDLTGSDSEGEAVARLSAVAENGEAWLFGAGWNQVLWPSGEFPSKTSLDAVITDRPVALSRVDRHALWVNSKALSLAGITADTPDPAGGQIVRDDAGEPTGILIDNAMRLIAEALPEATVESKKRDLSRAMRYLVSLGMTGAHDAGSTALEVDAYDALLKDGEFPMRIYSMLRMADPLIEKKWLEGPRKSTGGLFELRSVKISADGALGSRGAALFEDYSDDPGNKGLLLLSDEELSRQISRSAELGYQVNVHAIGDRANAKVLDEFEALNASSGQRALRHRVEHAQILRPVDIQRFAELDVIASVQPTHATSDKNMAGTRLGEDRLEGAYAWQSLFESGAKLAGGSDFPVEPPNPFFGLHAAVTRQDRDGEPPGGWRVGEALSRNKALSLFTEDAAYSGHAETQVGRLLPGYAADFILVRDDFFAVPREQLWKNKVHATVVAGELVFGEL